MWLQSISPLKVHVSLYLRLAFFPRFGPFSVFFSSVCRAVVTACLLLLRMPSRWCSISASVAVGESQMKDKNVKPTLRQCFVSMLCSCLSPILSERWQVNGSLCCRKRKSRRVCCTEGRLNSCSESWRFSCFAVYTVAPLFTWSADNVKTSKNHKTDKETLIISAKNPL